MSVLDIPAHLDGEHVVTRTPVIGEAGALQLRHGSSFRRPRGSHRRGREAPPMPASRPTTEVVGLSCSVIHLTGSVDGQVGSGVPLTIPELAVRVVLVDLFQNLATSCRRGGHAPGSALVLARLG